MLLVFLILIIVTVCVTIVGTYFLLNAENYHWQWTSFFSAASTAVYVYLYSIYYYSVKTKMSGFFQTSFYFGYTLMFCLGLGILCGKFLQFYCNNNCGFYFFNCCFFDILLRFSYAKNCSPWVIYFGMLVLSLMWVAQRKFNFNLVLFKVNCIFYGCYWAWY